MKLSLRHIFKAAIAVAMITILPVCFAAIKINTDKIYADQIGTPLLQIDDLPRQYWTKLAEKRIFFGHQSVGSDIIDGIAEIIEEHDYIKLNIVKTTAPAAFDRPIFAHSQIGKCLDPASKIEDFKNVMKAGVGNKVDIAFLKFCHSDIKWESDIHDIFDNYREAFEKLKLLYPETKFLHVTVPICSKAKRARRLLRESVKLLIGRAGLFDDNIKRQRYNTFLYDAYSKKEPIFNLALAESVNPAGFRCYIVKAGEKVFVKAPQYGDGIGSLNKEGKKRAAEQLLIILAEVANKL